MTLDPLAPSSAEVTDDLLRIARSIPPIPNDFAELRDLLARITNPVAPSLRPAREGELPTAFGEDLTLVSKERIGSSSGSLLGITPNLFYGQANVLDDPTMEGVSTQWSALTTTLGTNIAEEWAAHYTLISGTAPSVRNIYTYYRRTEVPEDNPFSSNMVVMHFWFDTTAGKIDAFLYPVDGFWPSTIPLLAYLTAGIKLKRETTSPTTTITVRMQITNYDQSVILAESAPLDYQSLTVNTEVRALWASLPSPTTNSYFWRLKVTLDHAAGSTDEPYIIFGEPLLQMTPTAELPPYSPILGTWLPAKLSNSGWDTTTGDTGQIIRSIAYLAAHNAFEVYRSGLHRWGGGSALPDLGLFRKSASVLAIDNALGGTVPAVLDLEGSFRQSGTSFPSSPSANDRFYRSDAGLSTDFRYDGSRWNSVNRHVLPLQNVLALPIAASSTPTRAPVPPMGTGTDLNLKELATAFYVDGGTALDASNKWVGSFRKVDASTPTTIATVTIDSGTSTTWRRTVTALDVLLGGTGYEELEVIWQKTGTPGNLYVVSTLSYYLVST